MQSLLQLLNCHCSVKTATDNAAGFCSNTFLFKTVKFELHIIFKFLEVSFFSNFFFQTLKILKSFLPWWAGQKKKVGEIWLTDQSTNPCYKYKRDSKKYQGGFLKPSDHNLIS